MNNKLKKLYNEKWENLILHSKGTKAAYPLLIKVSDDYKNADIRVMIVGQETDGWGGLLEENDKSITELQTAYFEYLYKNKRKNRRPFWNRKNFKYYKEQIIKKFPNCKVSFIWSNVSKIGKTSRGEPTKKIASLESNFFNVFEDELKILKPNIIIFSTGDRHIPLRHQTIKAVRNEPVSEVDLKSYPDIYAVRTYHPNARIEGGKKHLKEEVSRLVFEAITNVI